jgi:L-rhamnose isomerase
VTIENERAVRQLRSVRFVGQIVVDETLDALIGGAEIIGEQPVRLALMEEIKTFPVGAVWDYHCLKQSVPVGGAWLDDVRRYEEKVLSKRY